MFYISYWSDLAAITAWVIVSSPACFSDIFHNHSVFGDTVNPILAIIAGTSLGFVRFASQSNGQDSDSWHWREAACPSVPRLWLMRQVQFRHIDHGVLTALRRLAETGRD